MRIKSVTKVQLQEAVPVYDLTVDETHNFKLFNGPFVHNSKDCSDAIAGVVYGLTMRREIWASHNVPFTYQYSSTKEVKVTDVQK